MALLRTPDRQYVTHYDSSNPKDSRLGTHRQALQFHRVQVSQAQREAQELRAAGFNVEPISDNGESLDFQSAESATAMNDGGPIVWPSTWRIEPRRVGDKWCYSFTDAYSSEIINIIGKSRQDVVDRLAFQHPTYIAHCEWLTKNPAVPVAQVASTDAGELERFRVSFAKMPGSEARRRYNADPAFAKMVDAL